MKDKSMKKKNSYSMYLIYIIALFFVMAIFWIVKGTFSLDSQEDTITLDCPDVVNKGTEVLCDIYLNYSDGSVTRVKANYDLSEELTYSSFGVSDECNTSECFEPLEVTENGFTITNLNGFSGKSLIGKLRVMASDSIDANSNIKVGLKEIQLVLLSEDDEIIELDEVSKNIRIANEDATLANLSLSNGTLNEEFSSSQFNYTATVSNDIDKLQIIPTLSDNNATLSGNGAVSEVTLHYGTNNFDIVVTAEDGITEYTYNVTIKRQYEFSTSVYTYDKENNYIYTGFDRGDTIKANLESLQDENLNYDILNDNLLVQYNHDETLISIPIVNITTEYSIIDKKIVVSNTTYEELLQHIESNNSNILFKLIDKDNNEITDNSVIINSDDRLIISYNDKLLDSYDFMIDYLVINNDLIIDDNKKIIKRLTLGTTYNGFKDNFDTNGEITIISNGNTVTEFNDIIKTGDIIRITLSDSVIEYKLSVLGDMTGNGIVKINDVNMLYKLLKGRLEDNDLYFCSGDINNDGVIKINEVNMLYKYLKGRLTSLEVIK